VILWIPAVVVAAFLTLLLHESSHALVVVLRGARIKSFKPYPHKDENGRWWYGRVTWEYTPEYRDTKWKYGSPLLFNTPLAILYAVGAYFWCPYLWAFAAWSTIDHLWWWRGYFGLASKDRRPLLDGFKFRYHAQ
jgi:hypothetical protein